MRTARKVLIPILAAALILAGALALTWADTDVQLAGITIEDTHPNGCVDCHAKTDGGDYRLNVSLKELSGHPDISRIVNTVPTDCAMCHKPKMPAGDLNNITHSSHYDNPDENHFIEYYNGDCLSCHSLNTATGVMTMKTGAKNW